MLVLVSRGIVERRGLSAPPLQPFNENEPRTKVVRQEGAFWQRSGWQSEGGGTSFFWGRISSSVVFPAPTKACTSLSWRVLYISRYVSMAHGG